MYLIGPDGEFMDFFTQLMSASEIAAKIENKLKVVEPTLWDTLSSLLSPTTAK